MVDFTSQILYNYPTIDGYSYIPLITLNPRLIAIPTINDHHYSVLTIINHY